MATLTSQNAVGADAVISSLNQLLADSYVLMGQTHLAHWNVEGTDFFQLHAAFQSQYEELFAAVDEIAERVRSLGAYAEGGLDRFAELTSLSPLPVGRQSGKEYVAQLIDSHEKVASTAKQLEQVAGDTDDLETQDLAIGRRQVHQKVIWMLTSYLK